MTLVEIKQNIWRNTVSNYVCIGLRLVTGLVMFRMLYQGLSSEEFGFWALLWAVFGYGILLDFGFGFTAQKRVAELSVRGEWRKLSEVLSTVFFSYVGVALILILAGLFGADLFMRFVSVSEGNREAFGRVLGSFLCGIGIAFPLGLFPEILRGQQRISLANYVFCVGMLLNFTLVALAVHNGWGLKALVWIALGCTFLQDFICGFFAFRGLPGVRIHPRFFSKKMVSETMSFSLYAYVITLSTLILTKTDQLVIGSALAVSVVATYQAASKVAEVFAGITQQLPDTFSPVAAHLHAKGDRDVLVRLLVDGTRFSVMLATPLYLIFAFYMSDLLHLLTGDSALPRDTFWSAQILLFWGYILIVTQSVSKRVFMMCGHEKRLVLLATGEALLNLGLSIGMILYFKNIVCVALGSLLSSFIFGVAYLWPWAAREARMTSLSLARTVLAPTWLACLPLLGLILLQKALPALSVQDNRVALLGAGLAALAVAAWGLWKLALTASEREKLGTLLAKWLNRGNAA